jgi:hypothetical protein
MNIKKYPLNLNFLDKRTANWDVNVKYLLNHILEIFEIKPSSKCQIRNKVNDTCGFKEHVATKCYEN